MAESVGFEPTVRCRTLVFKTSAFDRSANSPYWSGVPDSNRLHQLGRLSPLPGETPQYGLGGEIRTPDPLVPNQMRYQTALHRVGIG